MSNRLSPFYTPMETVEFLWPDAAKLDFMPEPSQTPVVYPAFQQAFEQQKKDYLATKARRKFKKLSSLSSKEFDFVSKGYHYESVDIDGIKSVFEKHIADLKKKSPNRSHYAYDRATSFGANTPECKAVRNFYNDAGLNQLASVMAGEKVTVSTVVLHYSEFGDVVNKQVLSDIAGFDPATRAMHIDPKHNVKSLLYLEDVAEKDGPFCFIPESHLMGCDFEKRMAAYANCTLNYLDSPEKRQNFMNLPEQYRVTSIFGSTIADTDNLSAMYASQEVALLSEGMGNIILFPASGLVHRGGLCAEGGSRINLQITFK